jgi:predicted MFS family arabinose efflux permease
LLPAGPGALIGGWLGEHVGLRASLWFAGLCGMALTAAAWQLPRIRGVKTLPKAVNVSGTQVVNDATT